MSILFISFEQTLISSSSFLDTLMFESLYRFDTSSVLRSACAFNIIEGRNSYEIFFRKL